MWFCQATTNQLIQTKNSSSRIFSVDMHGCFIGRPRLESTVILCLVFSRCKTSYFCIQALSIRRLCRVSYRMYYILCYIVYVGLMQGTQNPQVQGTQSLRENYFYRFLRIIMSAIFCYDCDFFDLKASPTSMLYQRYGPYHMAKYFIDFLYAVVGCMNNLQFLNYFN